MITTSLPDFLRDERIERSLRLGSGQFELVNFYLSLLVLGLSVLYLCLLQNQSNYDLFNMGSLQRVWRCRQTNLVLDKGGVKISTRNCPLSP